MDPRAAPRRRFASLLPVLALAACGVPASDAPAAPGAPGAAAQVARSGDGMVATAHPLATRAGAAMLARGGNAVDAAVAAAFALAVVEPSMSGLGGRTQIILRTPGGEIHGIDATTQAPAHYVPPEERHDRGYPVVGVPGTVAGLTKAQKRFGVLSLAEVMAPAVGYARNGFELLPGEAARQAAAAEDLAGSEGARRYFLKPDGTTRSAGEVWVQEDLARTLELIAQGGADAFYRGEIARAIAADMEEKGGWVSLEALAAYEAPDSRIVRGSYRGHGLAGLWMPSYGAIAIEILQILEALPVDELDGAAYTAAVGQAIALGLEDRSLQGDWEDARRLTSKEWARRRAAEVKLPEGVAAGGAAALAPAPAAPSPRLAEASRHVDGHTTHLTTADRNGMMVALTQSNGPNMGSKVAAPGLGFLYAATLGGYLGDMGPGERASSNIAPFLVLRDTGPDNEPFMALGAAGGSRIIPAVVWAVSRVVDQGMGLGEALAAPRVYPVDEGFQMETHPGAFTADEVGAVEALGFQVEPRPDPASFGRIHAVLFDDDTGEWVGAADPDWEGSAMGPGGAR